MMSPPLTNSMAPVANAEFARLVKSMADARLHKKRFIFKSSFEWLTVANRLKARLAPNNDLLLKSLFSWIYAPGQRLMDRAKFRKLSSQSQGFDSSPN